MTQFLQVVDDILVCNYYIPRHPDDSTEIRLSSLHNFRDASDSKCQPRSVPIHINISHHHQLSARERFTLLIFDVPKKHNVFHFIDYQSVEPFRSFHKKEFCCLICRT